MKAYAKNLSLGVLLLSLPMALLAQTDGTAVSADPTTTSVSPQESAIAPPPASPQEATPSAQVSPAPSPAAQPSAVPATTTSPVPAPSPSPAMLLEQPAPTPSPSAADIAPEPAVPAPASEPVSLEDVQGAVEQIAEVAPEGVQPVFAAVAGALGGIVFMFGLWEFLKRFKGKDKKPCDGCGGTGTKPADEKCRVCGGTRKIEKEIEVTIACLHCKGTGTDPCHHCSGTGKMSMPNPPQSQEELEGWPPCDFCGGSGKKKVGAGRDWGEANDAMKGDFACCFCRGKKTETFKQKVQIDCPLCVKK